VADAQIAHLAKRSKELDQETRVSVYLFSDRTECIIYDKDVMRLPSLKSFYKTSGCTALIDASLLSISELKQTAQLHGDHAFLIYVLTDGQENASRSSHAVISQTINELPENWTIAALVPDQTCVFEAKRFGFPADNIQVWSSEKAGGFEEAGQQIKKATENFMQARAAGVRGTRNLFQLDASKLKKTTVKKNLTILKPSEYEIIPVRKDSPIRAYAEDWFDSYTIGSGYYQLMKKEVIQNYKQICVQDKKTGKVYSGDNARTLLGLPDFEVKVAPSTYGDFNIFVQSTSVNRKLIAGTQLLILK
jgi:predicted Rdx family selenoprotein